MSLITESQRALTKEALERIQKEISEGLLNRPFREMHLQEWPPRALRSEWVNAAREVRKEGLAVDKRRRDVHRDVYLPVLAADWVVGVDLAREDAETTGVGIVEVSTNESGTVTVQLVRPEDFFLKPTPAAEEPAPVADPDGFTEFQLAVQEACLNGASMVRVKARAEDPEEPKYDAPWLRHYNETEGPFVRWGAKSKPSK